VSGHLIHPPKVETFDLAAGVNVDPKGIQRPLEASRVTDFGLYVARPLVDHPRIASFESWILPELGLRVTDYAPHPGLERHQDHYIDIIDATVSGRVWRTVDHYLDIVVRTGGEAVVLDTDELLAAYSAGYVDAKTAERALDTTYQALAGIASHGYDAEAWLRTHDVALTWPGSGVSSTE
jgi:predicted RNA-binding protein associated with RNAse of E/G family